MKHKMQDSIGNYFVVGSVLSSDMWPKEHDSDITCVGISDYPTIGEFKQNFSNAASIFLTQEALLQSRWVLYKSPVEEEKKDGR